jgi:molybdenum cofactor cytidylyltransferase
MQPRAAILASGKSSRTGGRQKLLEDFRGRPMIRYAIEASRAWSPVVVASADVAAFLGQRCDVRTILNDKPELGMAYSLVLANAQCPANAPLIVLLADKPLVTAELIQNICESARDADVAFPVHTQMHEPGHPVVFLPQARAKVAQLADGDTIWMLRDDPALIRKTFETTDPGAFFDVDTLEDLRRGSRTIVD